MSSSGTLATADIVVVGAGLVGLCTAWELRRRGFSVVVVEQRFPSYGSSGRNSGCIWVQTRRAGVEMALALAGRAKYEEYVDALGDVFDFRGEGGLFFWETDAQAAVIERYVADRRAAGLDIELLSPDQASKLSPIFPRTALGAAFCAQDAQIDTLSFLDAMDAACVRAGVRIFRNTTVLSTVRDGDRVLGVRTVRGEVSASGVVWATGAWASTLRSEGIAVPVQTTRVGQVMMQPVAPQAGAILHGPRGVSGCGGLLDLPAYDAEVFRMPALVASEDRKLDYDDVIALNRGGSMYIGNSIDGRGSLNPHISLESTQAMVDCGLSRYPDLAEQGVTGLWAGLGSETEDGLPIVGQVDGVFVNAGHAWGVASAPAAGQVLAELIAGEKSEFAADLSPDRPRLIVAE